MVPQAERGKPPARLTAVSNEDHAGPLREIAGRVGHDEQGEAHSERRDYRPAALEPTRRATP
jgi:hypothetical protein